MKKQMYKTVTEFSCFIKVQKKKFMYFHLKLLNKQQQKLWIFYVFRCVVLILYFIFIQTSFHLYHKIPHMLWIFSSNNTKACLCAFTWFQMTMCVVRNKLCLFVYTNIYFCFFYCCCLFCSVLNRDKIFISQSFMYFQNICM